MEVLEYYTKLSKLPRFVVLNEEKENKSQVIKLNIKENIRKQSKMLPPLNDYRGFCTLTFLCFIIYLGVSPRHAVFCDEDFPLEVDVGG